MSKQDLLKTQSCVLKVNIHCDGCGQKVKKLLRKIDGVSSVNIDAEQGKVIVSGNVDPAKLLEKLRSSGKHAELWGGQKGMTYNQSYPTNQFKNLQIDHGKGGKDNKSQKGGKAQQKGGGQLAHFRNKGDEDLKLHAKDQKSVKFNLPDEGFDEFGDDEEFGDYDDEDDEEEFGRGHNKMMGNGRGPATNNHKGNGGGGASINAKKGDVMNLPMQMKGKGGNNEFKNGNGGGKKSSGGGGKQKGGGGGGNKAKSGGYGGGLLGRLLGFSKKSNKAANNTNKSKGSGGGNKKGNEGKKGGGKFEGLDMNKIDEDDDEDDLKEFDIPNHGKGGKGGKGSDGNVGQRGGPNPMGEMGNIAALQGMPAMNGGYYQGTQMQHPPPMPYNPQHQYTAMMMNHNQQQQANMNNMYPPMMQGRPYMPPPPMPSHPMADPMTHVFSDENTESCTIM